MPMATLFTLTIFYTTVCMYMRDMVLMMMIVMLARLASLVPGLRGWSGKISTLRTLPIAQ